ncbi:MAG: bifunctional metallophosphatase/5'-nucleotidase [Verrucomicrobia bacterium]|jgi:alkaline phosphatase|nr:bifunctional metallophosphatase/5'-nucleotidase [Verrucomicrobiota bacterium]
MKKIRITAISGLLAACSLSAQTDFSLQLLHASDLEGGVDAINRAANFAALVEGLENNDPSDGTLTVSAGDNIIPGPFLSAASDSSLRSPLQTAYQNLFGEPGLTNVREGSGRIDITIMNIIGFDASALGNHEFDLGSDALESIIEEDVRGSTLGDIRWPGAQFPYLSSNLDFSSDGDLGNLFTTDILPKSAFTLTPAEALGGKNPPKIAQATIVEVNGEPVGVIGATTQRLNQISSPSGTVVVGATDNDITLLASQLQPIIDAVALGSDGLAGTADDIDKIVLVTHLQQFSLEQSLATQLSGVDVIVAGGSDTLLANPSNTLLPGDTAAGNYPFIATDLDSKPTLIVSTDGEYSYIGRLIVPFDVNGDILTAELDATVNGPIASTDTSVASLWGGDSANAFTPGSKGSEVAALTNPVETIVSTQDGNVFGYTAFFLEGRREAVRTEETSLGNLTADANLAAAQALESDVVISIKNGGGIRAAIGTVDGITGELLPPAANPAAIPTKPLGAVSELDVKNSLRFNNGLVALDLSGQDILEVLQHAFAQSFEGATQGRFPQIGGLQVSFLPPVDVDGNGSIDAADGDTLAEINSFALLEPDGSVARTLYKDGAFVGTAATDEFRVVTLGFLVDTSGSFTNIGTPGATGGDGYPFPALAQNFSDLGVGEQAAMENYLNDNFGSPEFAYSEPDLATTQDARIQNLDIRLDSIGNRIPQVPAGALRLSPVATYASGSFDESAAEIVAHDPGTQRLFVSSADGQIVRVIDASDPIGSGLTQTNSIAAPFADFEPNSVAVKNGVLATAWSDETGTAGRGYVTLHDTSSLAQIGGNMQVGFLPDMLTFTPNGNTIVVANEGEIVGATNPVGSVSLIDISAGAANPVVHEVGFQRWNRRERILRSRGIQLTQVDEGLAANVAEDLEPEYVAVDPDSRFAWVALQENNAVALIDIQRRAVRNILPLGLVDHSNPRFALDTSDKDDAINIEPKPAFGLRQPDAIALHRFNGRDYLLTANEGDARGFEEARIKSLTLSSSLTSARPGIADDEDMGRWEINAAASDTNGDGTTDVLIGYGSRSMTAFSAPVVGRFRPVADTGSDFEMFTASRFSTVFNSNNDDNDSFESRSDAKGVEPEAITLGTIDGVTYAFIGMERQGTIAVYDVTDPRRPVFHGYFSNRSFVDENGTELLANSALAGDLGPEDIKFIAAGDSPLGAPTLAVANEVSGTVTLWRIDFGI